MRIDPYVKKVTSLSAFLLLLTVGLSILLYTHGPRVRYVQFPEDSSSQTLTRDTSFQIVFDRPLEQRDYSDSIQISPSIEFDTSTNTQNITISLRDNLQHNSTYTVTVLPEITDQSGTKMKQPFTHSFVTPPPSFAYLERNYGYADETLQTTIDADDHIKIARLGSEPEIIFSHPEIRMFRANRDYVIVAAKEETSDSLHTINLKNGEVRSETILAKSKITSIALAARGHTALFTLQPNYNEVSPEYYAQFANKVESINLKTGEVTSITSQDGTPTAAISILPDAEGHVALIQDELQTFYAISPFNDYDPVPIGAYARTFGFNADLSEVIFRDGEDFIRYSIANGGKTPIEINDSSGFVQTIHGQNNEIFYAESSFNSGESTTNIYSMADWQEPPQRAWRQTSESTGSRLKDFTPSYDGKLLALEQNPNQCQFDTLGTNSACMTSYYNIANVDTGEVLSEFPGINLVWLP